MIPRCKYTHRGSRLQDLPLNQWRNYGFTPGFSAAPLPPVAPASPMAMLSRRTQTATARPLPTGGALEKVFRRGADRRPH